MDLTTLPQLWGILLGLFLPGITAVIQQPHYSRTKRVLIAIATAVVLGTATTFFSGNLDLSDPTSLLLTIGAVLVSAQTAYESLWQPSGVTQIIEQATSKRVTPEAEFHTFVDDTDPADEPCCGKLTPACSAAGCAPARVSTYLDQTKPPGV